MNEKRPPPWRAAWPAAIVLMGAAIAILGVVPTTARHDPAFCTASCHTGESKPPLPHAKHDGTACQECHGMAPGVSLRLAAARWLGTEPATHGGLRPGGCKGCHGPTDANWAAVARTAGHARHTDQPDVTCLSCHGGALHDGGSAARACSNCHSTDRVHDERVASENTECLSCHEFSVTGFDEEPVLTIDRCSGCHATTAAAAAPRVTPAQLHGGADCKLCHDPHRSDASRANRPCTECHALVIKPSDRPLPKEHVECTHCHEPHAAPGGAQQHCTECHTQARARSSDERPTALRHDACASCHPPHEWQARPNGCVLCHGEEKALVFGQSPEPHRRCGACHEVHGPAPTGAVCLDCHEGHGKKTRGGPEKHRDCTSCHAPHAPHAETPASCATCHPDPTAQLVSIGPDKHLESGCLTCHEQHGPPKRGPRACARCHESNASKARSSKPPEHQNCASCHAPHRFDKKLAPAACRSCHAETVSSTGSHRDPCRTCHEPHGDASVSAKACASCHEERHDEISRKGAPHRECGSCHQPHLPGAAARNRCDACHQPEHRVAMLWPANSAHSGACTSCHQPHDARSKQGCDSCHATEASSAKNGKHACTTCHSPHDAPPASKAGWWQRCPTCHQTEAAYSKKHAPCGSCHEPHQFAEPSCTACHANAKTKGAHAMPGHADCTACHQAHSASIPGRKECLSCHRTMQNHQPRAAQCQSCHPFD